MTLGQVGSQFCSFPKKVTYDTGSEAKPMVPESDNPSTPRMGYWMKRIAKIQNRKVKWLEKQKMIKNMEK